jgi:hypothetical protein
MKKGAVAEPMEEVLPHQFAESRCSIRVLLLIVNPPLLGYRDHHSLSGKLVLSAQFMKP